MRLALESRGPKASHLRAALVLLVALSTATPALAGEGDEPSKGDTEIAAETFRAGAEAYKRKDYRAAALSFEMSHQLAPHGAALYNAGLAWQAAKEAARAADAYDEALATDQLSEAQRTDATARLTKLQPDLGRVSVEAPQGATFSVAAHKNTPTPHTIHLPPGEHEVHARLAEGTRLMQRVSIEAGAEKTLLFEAPEVDDAPPPPPPPPPPAEGDAFPLLPVGLGLAGVGVVAGGAAIFLGLGALGARDDFEDSGRTDVEAHDDADSLRTFTNVAWIGAGVFATAGAVLIVLDLTSDDSSVGAESAWRLQVAPLPGGVSARGRF